ncbi:hypothetical protein PHYPSEUDO_008267 [Phytophthora pseudosyringae]|uniref:Uncharacterized protein n=1 Tax=Phytophthora pseudosyringae TaxID=221518 RepID=A0A8T1VF40_9STRA|nr:hypothetical protein PHYPSEUDO_008267 [Phytophthora pseudosyringae]
MTRRGRVGVSRTTAPSEATRTTQSRTTAAPPSPPSARQPAELSVAAVQAAGTVVPAAGVARRSLSALRRRPVARVRVRLVPRKIVLTVLPLAFLFLAFGGEGKHEHKHRIPSTVHSEQSDGRSCGRTRISLNLCEVSKSKFWRPRIATGIAPLTMNIDCQH